MLAVVAMTMFAMLARLGMSDVITGVPLFLLFVLLRGVGFGTAIAAVPPTAQAYIADVTTDETARVKGMAGGVSLCLVSSGSGHLRLVGLSVLDHGVEDVAAAPREADERGIVLLSSCSFPVVVGAASRVGA